MEGHLRHGRNGAVNSDGGGRVLCRLEDIPDGAAKGFDLGTTDAPDEIFVVRRGARVFAYRNACPHIGTPLDWRPDSFMSGDGGHIMCHTHGALFEIEDGHCVAGPCAGDSLSALPVRLEGGRVVLEAAADPRR
jgi:nitrite reductase/ring-hydroxylating ferredoxin subunit